MSKVWKTLVEYVGTLSESRQYRGATAITLNDIKKLVGDDASPNGGYMRTKHSFSTDIWTGWQDKSSAALAIASTDSKRDVQSGNAQGGVVAKTNWGGKVGNVPAKIRQSPNSHLGSSMDRYDIFMIADIEEKENSRGRIVTKATLTGVAWSPSIGNSDARAARLKALVSGEKPEPLPRRPQGETPSSNDEPTGRRAEKVPRQGDSVRPIPDEMPTPQKRDIEPSTFKQRLATHNAEYSQQAKKADDDDDYLDYTDDEDDQLFGRRNLPPDKRPPGWNLPPKLKRWGR